MYIHTYVAYINPGTSLCFALQENRKETCILNTLLCVAVQFKKVDRHYGKQAVPMCHFDGVPLSAGLRDRNETTH